MSLDEKSQKLGEMLAQIRNAFHGATEAIDTYINFLGKPLETKQYDVEKISWIEKDGTKGKYEYADAKTEGGKTDFKALLTDLKEHNGKFRHGDKFYWVFSDAAGIGRKKVVK